MPRQSMTYQFDLFPAPQPGEDGRDAAMAGVTGGDPPGIDGAHRTAVRRSRKLRARLPAEGGRS